MGLFFGSKPNVWHAAVMKTVPPVTPRPNEEHRTPLDPKQAPSSTKSAHFWVSSTYFAEGFPYAIVHNIADVMFKELGASLSVIGLTSLFHLPWNLKFLWGPLLDQYGTKRQWLLLLEWVIPLVIAAIALTTLSLPPTAILLASVGFFLLAVLSATHDIAIDGYYLEALDKAGQSRFVGYRAAAYRIAMLFVSGPLLMLMGRVGWFGGLLLTAALMIGLFGVHRWMLPAVETPKQPLRKITRVLWSRQVAWIGGLSVLVYLLVRLGTQTTAVKGVVTWVTTEFPAIEKLGADQWIGLGLLSVLLMLLAALPTLKRRMANRKDHFYVAAFTDFLSQPKVGVILAFVILFRTGESFLMKMRYPFFNGLGMDVEQYGFANGTVGLFASIVGTVLGGKLIARGGLDRWIWPFVAMQNVLNLLFAGLGAIAVAYGGVSLGLMTAVLAVEAFGAGLGTAVLMVYLMRCCRPDFKAAHMAILTALMSLSFTVAGVSSGYLAEAMGFMWYFVFSFVATVPAMCLIPFLPYVREP
ncbi:MAG: hypothetical protein HUU55_24200 [Myxococcales bacterium]|nr:hypothetical protein [Myxococcales bacterium]